MKFSIITPTFKRKDLLVRAVDSLLSQTYKDWEIIIVNDSPKDESYFSFASSINDPRIHYHANLTNSGVNFSRNFALDHLSADSRWVIFLDDDDYFAPDTLQNFHDLILLNPDKKWFMTNRALRNGESLTRAPSPEKTYNYIWNYLILRRIKGDATHCIETKLLIQERIRFSSYVRQAEEWFFFYQVGLHTPLFYSDHNSTISGGYDENAGLNFRKRTIGERFESLLRLFYEAVHKKILSLPFFVYLFLRLLRLFIPK